MHPPTVDFRSHPPMTPDDLRIELERLPDHLLERLSPGESTADVPLPDHIHVFLRHGQWHAIMIFPAVSDDAGLSWPMARLLATLVRNHLQQSATHGQPVLVTMLHSPAPDAGFDAHVSQPKRRGRPENRPPRGKILLERASAWSGRRSLD